MATTRIYIAPFKSPLQPQKGDPCAADSKELVCAIASGQWPYDMGDDPSFYCSKKYRMPLTWGICRPDVRNAIQAGDIVVFFAFRKHKEDHSTEYMLCAVATVDKKVCMTDLWRDEGLNGYKTYYNLLVEPQDGTCRCWKHSEPVLTNNRLHDDWLWRIAEHRGLTRKAFEEIQRRDRFCLGETVGGDELAIAENYVIFYASQERTVILKKPPTVAWHHSGDHAETWNKDGLSDFIKAMTLDEAARVNSKRRFLRLPIAGHPHRHIVWEVDDKRAEQWRRRIHGRLTEVLDVKQESPACGD